MAATAGMVQVDRLLQQFLGKFAKRDGQWDRPAAAAIPAATPPARARAAPANRRAATPAANNRPACPPAGVPADEKSRCQKPVAKMKS